MVSSVSPKILFLFVLALHLGNNLRTSNTICSLGMSIVRNYLMNYSTVLI